MLAYLSILATTVAGVAKAPWWFWIMGGAALGLLSVTDPHKLRPRLADGDASGVLLLSGLTSLSIGCLASAAAFSMGRIISWVLPI